MTNPIIYMVIPCYNEEEVLPETHKRLAEKYDSLVNGGAISKDSKIIFVNDGSKDRTWDLIKSYEEEHSYFGGINLSRNRGHQNALMAGLSTVKDFADAVISMDADLQDDINAIDEMVAKFTEGFDVVYGVRSSRATDTFFKRFTAQTYYKLLAKLGANLVYNHADYRLMSRRAIDGLMEFSEVNLFLRGVVPMVGYPSTCVYYERAKRFAGESKYPLKKMIALALDGITSLSVEPLRLILSMGMLSVLVGVVLLIYSIVRYFQGQVVAGWASLMVSLWFIGGMLMTSIGIVGEYVGKIYMETKGRPRFLVAESVGLPEKEND
ncbi:MAG: glycosyltransferase family 2 protein [Pseudobutyrivibrio sp.]|nr:glycosyltransferase family 2 protein [Pseudobutyrivibrio sp.]MCF0185970.1 glycosyltransferase family 2 protein [Bacteroidaceae bacterium]